MGLWELSQVDVLIEAYKLLVTMGLTLALTHAGFTGAKIGSPLGQRKR